LFRVHPESGEPVYLQLVRQVKHAVATGALKPGDRLPTVRELAARLVVNPNTVGRAYRELEQAGLLENTPGRGSFVALAPPRLLAAERRRRLQPHIDQLVAEARALAFDSDELLDLISKTLEALPAADAIDAD
jgi:GntR family transcriptional regulator